MDVVELALGTTTIDRVLGGCVRVPAAEVSRLFLAILLKDDVRGGGVVVGGGDGELWAKVPVVHRSYESVWVVEGGWLAAGESVPGVECNGRLLSAGEASSPS